MNGRGLWSRAEDARLLECVESGLGYAEIARQHFNGRSASAIKNRYYSITGQRRPKTGSGPALEILPEDIAFASNRLLEAQLAADQVCWPQRRAWLARHGEAMAA